MKRSVQALSALVLSASLLFSLLGCGEKADTGVSSATAVPETTATASESTAASETVGAETTAATTAPVTATGKQYVVNTNQDNLRMRKEPNLDAEVLISIPKGTVVTVAEESGGWSRVSFNGKTGWVKSDYLADADSAVLDSGEVPAHSNSGYSLPSANPATASPAVTKATSRTTTKKETTVKTTAVPTSIQTPATVTILIYGKRKNNMSMYVRVWPGETYTVEMARKDVAKKYPGEPFKIKGQDIRNYDPTTGKHYYTMQAFFNESMDSVAAQGAR